MTSGFCYEPKIFNIAHCAAVLNVQPGHVCIFTCKFNPLRHKHYCASDGQWDQKPGTRSCDEFNVCHNPNGMWGQYSWQCNQMGYHIGSKCIGTCLNDANIQRAIQCQKDTTWNTLSGSLDD